VWIPAIAVDEGGPFSLEQVGEGSNRHVGLEVNAKLTGAVIGADPGARCQSEEVAGELLGCRIASDHRVTLSSGGVLSIVLPPDTDVRARELGPGVSGCSCQEGGLSIRWTFNIDACRAQMRLGRNAI
jgi:hypothetical protein